MRIIINIKTLRFTKKGYGYLLNERDIQNKLFDLIYNIYKDQSLLKILSNQRQYSDKKISLVN